MSRNQTWPEKILWAKLRDNQLGVAWHKQKIILGYIVDFWCPRAGLVVEIDGPSHAKQVTYDKLRDHALWEKKIVTMRFSNQEVVNNVAAVVALIEDKMKKRMK
jgi:very-short-patch-repair endonuclease